LIRGGFISCPIDVAVHGMHLGIVNFCRAARCAVVASYHEFPAKGRYSGLVFVAQPRFSRG
jgi:hypothetical protein